MSKKTDELLIRGINDAMAEAWNRHDMKAFAANFTDSADFVNVLGQRMCGRREIQTQHEHIHRTIFHASTLRNLDQSVRLLRDDVALCHVEWEMKGHQSITGWKDVRQGIMTLVFVREGERWRITAVHNTDSVPVPASVKP